MFSYVEISISKMMQTQYSKIPVNPLKKFALCFKLLIIWALWTSILNFNEKILLLLI